MNSHETALVGGFTQVPNEYLRAPVSIGARLLLCLLFDFADKNGASFHKYEDFCEILGRSKGAISGYVAELRKAGYIRCVQLKYGNGHNASLQFYIKGWSDIVNYWRKLKDDAEAKRAGEKPAKASEKKPSRAGKPGKTVREAKIGAKASKDEGETKAQSPSSDTLSMSGNTSYPVAKDDPSATSSASEKTERPVQSSEHKINNNHINKHTCAYAQDGWSIEDENAWKKWRPNDKDSAFSGIHGKVVPIEVLKRAIIRADAVERALPIYTNEERVLAAKQALKHFCNKHGLETHLADFEAAASVIAGAAMTSRSLGAVMECLDKSWKPFWKKLSSPDQIKATIAGISPNLGLSPAEIEKIKVQRSRKAAAQIWLKRAYQASVPTAAPSMPREQKAVPQSHLAAESA
jgi:hypothetical protein